MEVSQKAALQANISMIMLLLKEAGALTIHFWSGGDIKLVRDNSSHCRTKGAKDITAPIEKCICANEKDDFTGQ